LQLTLQEVWTELLLVIGGSVVLMACSAYGHFPRLVGLLFTLTLIVYTYLIYRSSLVKNNGPNGNSDGQRSYLLLYLLILAGLFLLAAGSTLFIKGAVIAARYFGVSELVIGLTMAAVGTSLPELASSIAALRRKEESLIIGNVIGSNMFNLFMVLGLTGLVKPFSLSPDMLQRDLPVMLGFTLILVPLLRRYKGAGRLHGILLFTAYLFYCYSLL
jgi:cation:H+ antiporter